MNRLMVRCGLVVAALAVAVVGVIVAHGDRKVFAVVFVILAGIGIRSIVRDRRNGTF